MFADKEPSIVINGVVLDHAQAVAVRNAISTHRVWLIDNGLGDDQLGKDLCEIYQARLGEVEDIMLYPPR
ncbi:hypothetical protein J7S78_14235 [Klebsiella oxytoca]|uniref:Uncharacterized protein n=1 Tax=Klebsiella oxytoca TaxID=571 RepID=A0AAP2BIH8_KLEOX|nr:hypothetical protein [Klebsiella oxytoca]MBQ0600954.1 hypothetical protein [Klebsiella oxytoca]